MRATKYVEFFVGFWLNFLCFFLCLWTANDASGSSRAGAPGIESPGGGHQICSHSA